MRFAILVAVALLLLQAAHPAAADSRQGRAAAQAEEILRFQAQQERQRQQLQQPERTRAPQGSLPERPVAESPSGGDCIDISRIEVEGVTLLAPAAVEQAVAPYEGRCLALEDLNGALQELPFGTWSAAMSLRGRTCRNRT